MSQFNIIDYLSGLTSYTFNKSVLERIAFDRGVSEVDDYYYLDQRTKDLLLADLLFVAYTGANTSASYSVTDGAFKESVGSQTISDKRNIYDVMVGIYRRYGDDKLNAIPNAGGTLRWVNEED